MAIGPLEGDVDHAFETAREAFAAVGGTTLSLACQPTGNARFTSGRR